MRAAFASFNRWLQYHAAFTNAIWGYFIDFEINRIEIPIILQIRIARLLNKVFDVTEFIKKFNEMKIVEIDSNLAKLKNLIISKPCEYENLKLILDYFE